MALYYGITLAAISPAGIQTQDFLPESMRVFFLFLMGFESGTFSSESSELGMPQFRIVFQPILLVLRFKGQHEWYGCLPCSLAVAKLCRSQA